MSRKVLRPVEMQKLCCQLFKDFEIRLTTLEKRFVHKRWVVGMFWEQYLVFSKRSAAEEIGRELPVEIASSIISIWSLHLILRSKPQGLHD